MKMLEKPMLTGEQLTKIWPQYRYMRMVPNLDAAGVKLMVRNNENEEWKQIDAPNRTGDKARDTFTWPLYAIVDLAALLT